MKLEVVSATGLSVWASYLINGDSSGIEQEDIDAANLFIDWLGGIPFDCEDAGFMWRPDSCAVHLASGDCQKYSALVKVK